MQMYPSTWRIDFNPVMPRSPSCYVTKNSGGLFIQRTAGGTRYIYYNGRFKERGKANQEGEIVLEV